MFCTQCGSELPDGVTHCFICGTAVRPVPPVRPGQTLPAGQAPQPGPSAPPAPLGAEQAAQTGAPPAQPPRPAYQRQPDPARQPGPAYQPVRPFAAQQTETPADPGQPACRPAYQPAPPSAPTYQPGPAYPAYHAEQGRDSFDTVTTGEWLLTWLIACVPVANLIMLFVWAFGGGVKPSKRNWARAALIVFGGLFVLFFVLGVCVLFADPELRALYGI